MDPSQAQAERVALRAFPYPFRAMLAINSDIDRMSPWRFREVHRFLNTKEETPLGPGLGLDIADSLWFYRPRLGRTDPLSAELCFFQGSDWGEISPYGEEILQYVRCGWIDTIHGYGNFSGVTDPDLRFTRRHAEEALAVLASEGLAIQVWSNHGAAGNIQNIGHGPNMQGDDPNSPAYHADLLREGGIVYQWGLGDATEAGSATKLAIRQLQDGGSCWEFTRFSSRAFEEAERDGLPRWQAASEAERRKAAMVWLPRWLHVQLAESVLRGLVATEQFCIAAQHLGTARPMLVLGGPAADALRRLAEMQESGEILVARTSRLLSYNRVRDNLRYTVESGGDGVTLDVLAVDDPMLGRSVPSSEELRGITFEVTESSRTRLLIAGREVEPELVRRSSGDSGETIGLAWYEPDYTDYSEPFANELRVLASAEEQRRWRKASSAAAKAAAPISSGTDCVEASDVAALGACQSMTDRVIALRSLGFMEFEAVQLGCAAGEWCIALAEAGVAEVIGVDPRPPFLAAAEAAAQAAGVAERCTFRLATESSLELPLASNEFVLWLSGPGFSSVELVFDAASRLLRQNSALYASYSTLSGLLYSVQSSLEQGDGHWQHASSDLMVEPLCRRGISEGGSIAPDISDLLAIADSRGLALVDQPRLAGNGSFLGQPLRVEILFRREKQPDWLRDELLAAPLDDALRDRIRRLADAGASRLLAGVLEARAASGEDDYDLRRLRLQVLLRGGAAADPAVAELDTLVGDELLSALAAHARGDASGALARYARIEPTPTFLVGAAYLLLDDPGSAETAFREGLDQPGAGQDCLIGLLGVAAARSDRSAAEGWLRRLCASVRGPDQATRSPAIMR